MNQENKSGEFKEKLLQYWAAFLAACRKLWKSAKVNGRVLLQKLAAWLLKARKWLLKVTANLRVKGKAALESLAVWVAGVWEKLRPLPGRLKLRCQNTFARLKGGARTPEALPAAEEPGMRPAVEKKAEANLVEAVLPAAEQPAEAVISEAPVSKQTEEAAAKIANPSLRKAADIFGTIGKSVKLILKWIWKLRKVFMAAPVIWAAVKFAMENMDRLPEQVGLDIQSTGEFARMITREQAVYWPLGITMFCLLLMFSSKKPVLPWVISIFTLVLPWLIWILNYYA